MDDGQSRTVVVLGGYNLGFSLVRSLRHMPQRIVVVATSVDDFAQHSRFVDSWHRVTPCELVDWLLEQRGRWSEPVLLPSSDAIIELLLPRCTDLMEHYQACLPKAEVYRTFQDKIESYKFVEALGVPQPRCYFADTSEQLLDIAERLKYPALIRPASSHKFFSRFRCKLWMVKDFKQLRRRWEQANEAGIPCFVSEYIPGPDSSLFFQLSHRHKGERHGELLIQKLRQHPPGTGVGRVVRTTSPIPAMSENVEKILSETDHDGLSSAEFKFDERDGKYKFIELNLRPILQDYLCTAAGINLTQQIVDAASRRPVSTPADYRVGLYWHHAVADLVDCVRYPRSLGGVSLAELLAPYRQPDSVSLIPFREDPRLFFMKYFGGVRKILRRIWSVSGSNFAR
jgi:D-aspartate ligase